MLVVVEVDVALELELEGRLALKDVELDIPVIS